MDANVNLLYVIIYTIVSVTWLVILNNKQINITGVYCISDQFIIIKSLYQTDSVGSKKKRIITLYRYWWSGFMIPEK